MIQSLDDLISDVLSAPAPLIGYEVSRRLRTLYPHGGIVEGYFPAFNIWAYHEAGLCELTRRSVPHRQDLMHWGGPEVGQKSRTEQGLLDVVWEDRCLRVLIVHFQDGISRGPNGYHYVVIAETQAIAEAFHQAVCAWNTQEPDEYILVFNMGDWQKDDALLAAIAGTTLDSLILRDTLKEEIVADLHAFFAARETYAEYGIPWKRGILLLGPPGNGKTHTVKALINDLGRRCIYVKNFGHPMGIHFVFERARQIAPCLLVLEDLDSLIDEHTRAYFLNELDGFAANEGILTLATCNHPERLDPAILDRPSRFDRKYPFDLPGEDERRRYIALWNERLRPPLRLSPDAVPAMAAATEGFSFAYLKELFLSSMMRWIGGDIPMDVVMAGQVETLRMQMASTSDVLPTPEMPGGPPMGPRGGPARRHGVRPRPAEDIPL
ncbi:MAG TPA: ATP-binding protein [Chloroflexota bacterium]|nr:ATP-binding protein [Chloroflexota bacterium]